MYEDHHGRIWLATFGGGINYITEDKDRKTLFINHRNNLKGYPIDPCYKARFITSDNNGRLWVGTTTGAIAFDENFEKPEEVEFHHFSRVPNDTQSLSNNDVHWIIPTQNKELYLGTFGGGLNKLVSIDKDGHAKFESYSVQDGLLRIFCFPSARTINGIYGSVLRTGFASSVRRKNASRVLMNAALLFRCVSVRRPLR